MIVCSCNVLSDHDVRSAVESAQDLPRNAKQIYGCLGCSAECGRCARTIKTIIEKALGTGLDVWDVQEGASENSSFLHYRG